MPPTTTESPDRRVRIADAALQLLATQGARGLSHRAVDQELGLSPGSTSYYYRTRNALLLAAAERLVVLDKEDIQEFATAPDGAARLVERWLTPERRMRSIARIELLLTSARDPEFKFMRATRSTITSKVEGASRSDDRGTQRRAAKAIVALVDGFVLHGLVAGPISRADAGAALTHLRSLGVEPTPKRTRKRT